MHSTLINEGCFQICQNSILLPSRWHIESHNFSSKLYSAPLWLPFQNDKSNYHWNQTYLNPSHDKHCKWSSLPFSHPSLDPLWPIHLIICVSKPIVFCSKKEEYGEGVVICTKKLNNDINMSGCGIVQIKKSGSNWRVEVCALWVCEFLVWLIVKEK